MPHHRSKGKEIIFHIHIILSAIFVPLCHNRIHEDGADRASRAGRRGKPDHWLFSTSRSLWAHGSGHIYTATAWSEYVSAFRPIRIYKTNSHTPSTHLTPSLTVHAVCCATYAYFPVPCCALCAPSEIHLKNDNAMHKSDWNVAEDKGPRSRCISAFLFDSFYNIIKGNDGYTDWWMIRHSILYARALQLQIDRRGIISLNYRRRMNFSCLHKQP